MMKYLYIFMTLLFVSYTCAVAQNVPTPTVDITNLDDSIIRQEECVFPCWYEITPGITTTAELNQVIGKITFYSNAPTKMDDVEPATDANLVSTEYLTWWHTSPSTMNRLVIKNGVLSSLEIRETVEFTLGDVIDLYGEPAGINVIYDVGGDILHLNLILQLYYPDKGLVVDFRLVTKTGEVYVPEVTISRDAIGSRFYLFPPQVSLKDFAHEVGYVGSRYPVHEGWIGIGGKIVSPDSKTYPYGSPMYEADIESTEQAT